MAYGDFVTSVGAEVGIVRRNRSYGGLSMARFGTVTKINGHGHIFVQWDNGEKEMRFTRRGNAYKDDYGPHLCHAEQLRVEQAREEKRKTINTVARELEQKVKEGWGYSGTFHATDTIIEDLEALVAKLKENVK
jgi:flagellar hook protein FlgE